MFKNIILYRFQTEQPLEFAALEAALTANPFAPCQPSQEMSSGWVAPRQQEHAALLESIGGHWIARFMVEVKTVPGPILKRKAEENAQQIHKETGRKPGKKEMQEIKNDIRTTLLPQAFPKQRSLLLWLDPQAQRLIVEATSPGQADEVATALVQAIAGLSIEPLASLRPCNASMAQWLCEREAPEGFAIERECELKSPVEDKAVVRYGRHPLDIDEVGQHIEAGKLPTSLALSWDNRVSFVLTDGLQIKKVTLLDAALGDKDKDGGFDADVAIATGELSRLIPELIGALGGEAHKAANSPR